MIARLVFLSCFALGISSCNPSDSMFMQALSLFSIYPPELLSDYHRSLGIPIREDGEIYVGILCSPAHPHPVFGLGLLPPVHMVIFGEGPRIVDVRYYSKEEQAAQENERSGSFKTPEGIDPYESRRLREKEIVSLANKLMPDFQEGNVNVSAEVKEAAKEYKRIFDLVSEPSLRIDYYREGKQFFDWLDAVLAQP